MHETGGTGFLSSVQLSYGRARFRIWLQVSCNMHAVDTRPRGVHNLKQGEPSPLDLNPILWSAYSSFGRAIGDGSDVPAADKEL